MSVEFVKRVALVAFVLASVATAVGVDQWVGVFTSGDWRSPW